MDEFKEINCPCCGTDLTISISIDPTHETEEEEPIRCEHCLEEHPTNSQARKCCSTKYKRWLNADMPGNYDNFEKKEK